MWEDLLREHGRREIIGLFACSTFPFADDLELPRPIIPSVAISGSIIDWDQRLFRIPSFLAPDWDCTQPHRFANQFLGLSSTKQPLRPTLAAVVTSSNHLDFKNLSLCVHKCSSFLSGYFSLKNSDLVFYIFPSKQLM